MVKIQIKRLFLPKFRSLRSASITKRKIFLRRSLFTKKLATWLRSLGLKHSMDVSQLLRLPKRSMNIRLEQLTYHAKCLRQFLSFLCSNLRLSSCSKKKMIKRESLKKLCTDLTKAYHQLRLQKVNGRRLKGSAQEIKLTAMKEFKGRCSSLNCQQLESRLPRYQDLTLICQQISRSLVLMVCSLLSCRANQAQQCATS